MLDQLVASARDGQSQVLVLRGEAGVGKSALLEYLVANASGCRVARVVGDESEMELAFAGLHQFCAPMLDHLDRLPEPQRGALTTAFGLTTGEPPDRFLVGLAVLSLLAESPKSVPWSASSTMLNGWIGVSAQTIAFVARRLLAEPIALVFSVREPTDEREFRGLPELLVRGLNDVDARVLLDSVLRGPVDELVRDRIVAETRGNPLAILELPHGLTPAELAGGFGLPTAIPLASQIEQGFARRLQPLPVTNATPASDGGGRTHRGRHFAVACRGPSRDRCRCRVSCRDRRIARDRSPGSVPPSAGALRGLPVGVTPRKARRTRSVSPGNRS